MKLKITILVTFVLLAITLTACQGKEDPGIVLSQMIFPTPIAVGIRQ